MNLGNEVLTLQFGHYSNYIGSHWLNIQESGFSYNPNFIPEINNDVLFREGRSSNGDVTYTPRLLAVDFKRSFGHLEQVFEELPNGANYVDDEEIRKVHSSSNLNKNEFLKDLDDSNKGVIPCLKSQYNLDSTVTTWSDFLIPFLQENSLNTLSDYEFGVNHEEFSSFSLGKSLWKKSYFEDDFTDKIRLFLEESDNLQGFQVLIDIVNGFSGLGSSCVEYLRDEYDKKTIFCIPVYEINSALFTKEKRKDLLFSVMNSMLGMSEFSEHCSLVVPVSLSSRLFKGPSLPRVYKNFNYDVNLKLHTSAVIAAALETITTPYRVRNFPVRMDELCSGVSLNGRVVASLGTNSPFPMSNTDKLFTVLDKWEDKWFESLTPEVDLNLEDMSIQLVSTRGITKNSLLDELEALKVQDKHGSVAQCQSVEEMFKLFFNFLLDCSKTHVKSCDTACRVPPTFPRIFNETYNLTYDPSSEWGRLAELRALASLHNTSETQRFLEATVSPCQAKAVEKLADSADIDKTDFLEHIEQIERLISSYNNTSWQL